MKKKLMVMIAVFAMLTIMLANSVFADYYSDYSLLYEGKQGKEVSNLQYDLKGLGYFNYTPTGYFGAATEQSVIKFQKDSYLTADGIVGHATAREIRVKMVLSRAKSLIGVPYLWGGTTPSGFDCSGYTQYVFAKSYITIPKSAADQYNVGTWVNRDKLRPGDLVFFTTYKPGASHVGIYLGNNKFLAASSGAGYVTTGDLTNTYFAQHYIGTKRIIQ